MQTIKMTLSDVQEMSLQILDKMSVMQKACAL